MNTNSPMANERSDLDWINDAWQDIAERNDSGKQADAFDEANISDGWGDRSGSSNYLSAP